MTNKEIIKRFKFELDIGIFKTVDNPVGDCLIWFYPEFDNRNLVDVLRKLGYTINVRYIDHVIIVVNTKTKIVNELKPYSDKRFNYYGKQLELDKDINPLPDYINQYDRKGKYVSYD